MDFNAWLNDGDTSINTANRAVEAWSRIQRDPATITIKRQGTNQTAQTVRLVFERSTTRQESGETFVTASVQTCRLFGVRNHPDTDNVPDTDVQRDDTFKHDGNRFRVISVARYPGEVQAICEVTQ